MTRIHYLLDGASAARSTVVVIDVFRTTSVIATLFARGAAQVIPVSTPRLARQARAMHPDALLIGGRFGVRLTGFDSDVSPTQLSGMSLEGRTAIITSTNGTRGLIDSAAAGEVVVGSFLNARAVADSLRGKSNVTIVAVGQWYGRRRAVEDDCCAELIHRYLTDQAVDLQALRAKALGGLTSQLRRVVQRKDVEHCLRANLYQCVPRYADGVILAG